ncbi:MAG: SRPBCC family protein [Archangium sp.]|nr:SRPBCC family protein [Archangium sp.]
MKRLNRGIWGAVILSSLLAFAERPPAKGAAAPELIAGTDGMSPGGRFLSKLPFATRDTLRKEGHVVLDTKGASGDGLLRAVIRFERPIDEVFAIITQPSEQVGYLPHVTQSKTVGARTAEGEATDMVVSFFFTFRYRTQHWFYPEERRMEWTLDSTGDDGLTDQSGYYQLYALDERTTIAEYGTRVVAKGGFINFLRGLGERGGVAEAISAVRKHVASHR